MTPPVERKHMLGNCSRCWHTLLEKLIPRYYKGLPAYWCRKEIPGCPHQRSNCKGEAVCTKTCSRRRKE